MRLEGRWWHILCAPLPVFLSFSSLSSIPLLPSLIPLFFSFSTPFSSVSSSSFLFCPHLFLLLSSLLPSFHYVFLLCLPSFPSFSSLQINHFLFQRTSHFLFQRTNHFLLEGITCTELIEGIDCTVCIEGIACTVCVEGIACTVCVEGIACTVCVEGIACAVCLL